jgi:Fe2+ or Zn2+ uptake regulation protein
MYKKSNSVLEKLIPLGTIQRRQRQRKESKKHYFNFDNHYHLICFTYNVLFQIPSRRNESRRHKRYTVSAKSQPRSGIL